MKTTKQSPNTGPAEPIRLVRPWDFDPRACAGGLLYVVGVSVGLYTSFLVNHSYYEYQTWRCEETALVLVTVNLWSGKKRPDLRY